MIAAPQVKASGELARGRSEGPVATQPRSPRPALHSLTQLRFLAAFYVICFHYAKSYFQGGPTWLQNVEASGYVAVTLFFVLSGFVLAYTYLDQSRHHALDRTSFWVARLSRLYPVYFLALLLIVANLARETHRTGATLPQLIQAGQGIVAALLMVQSWMPRTSDMINSPGWSLSAEAFFYVVFPFLAPWLAQRTSRRIFILAIGLWLVSFIAPTGYILINPEHLRVADVLRMPDDALWSKLTWMKAVTYNPLVRLPEFVIGVAAGILYTRLGAALARRGRVVAAGAALVVLAALAASSAIPFPLLHNGLLAPLFAVMIFGLASADAAGGGRLLPGGAVLLLLGEASYGMYILQEPLWIWIASLGVKLSRGLPVYGYPTFFPVYALALIVASVVSLKVVESPARRYLRRRLASGPVPR